MKFQWIVFVVAASAAPLAACNNNNDLDDVTDTGATVDVATNDTSVNDGGTDTGTTMDTGTVTDAAADTGTDTGGGTPLNGCTAFTDLTAAGANRTITFTLTPPAYTPNCVTIAAGQMVTFSGDFVTHPLTPGKAPSRPATDTPSSEPNPITVTATGTTATFTFPTAGNYGYYCAVHQALGMYGVIRVQ